MKKLIAVLTALSMTNIGFLPVWAADEAKAERVALEGIQVQPDQVRLRFTAPVQYSRFVTAKPPRLVLEMVNTEVKLVEKIVEGQGALLKRVRSGQFMGEPNPVARVVLDLSQAAKDNISQDGSDLVISLSAIGGSIPAEAPSVASAPEPVMPGMNDAPAVKPATPKKKSDEPDVAAGELEAMASNASVMAGEEGGPAVAAPAPAPRKARASAGSTAGRVSGAARRDILSSLSRDPITLDLENTDIGDIIKMVAAKANVNMIHSADVSGTLSLHLSGVPFNEAFNIILSMKGLVASQVGENTVRIMTPKELEKERATAVGVTRMFTLNYSKASEVKTMIDAIRAAEKRQGSSVVDEKNNALVITDTVEGLSATERLLGQIDTRPRQVLIEAKLVEVALTKDLHLGIQWDYFQLDSGGKALGKDGTTAIGSGIGVPSTYSQPLNQNALTTPGLGSGAAGRGTGVLLPADKIFGAFTLGRITNNYLLSATLSAAAAQGKVKVLSDPKIATLNGKMATINITTSLPYVTANVAATGVATQSVSYTVTGIQLAVTPLINSDGRITLKVTPNVSKPSATAVVAGATGAVAVDTRQADTNVLVRDGETIVIGGLITDSSSTQISKIPILGDIPILGWLFKKKSVIRSRVELLIFVTTRIMPD